MWKCYYHEGQTLQNFCSNKQCSIPLCPKCIHSHLMTPQHHHLMSLDDMIEMTKESIKVCITELKDQATLLNNQLFPQNLHNSFVEIIQKYKNQSIEQILQYYKSLEQQIFIHIQNAYAQNLQPTKTHFDDKLKEFEQYLKDLNDQKTLIPTLININCHDQIGLLNKLLSAFQVALKLFSCLPNLQPLHDGKLTINARPVRRVETQNRFPMKKQNMYVDRLDRIAGLEDRLALIRSRTII